MKQKWTIICCSLLIFLLAACTAVRGANHDEIDEAAVYAAIIRQIYTVDDTFGGTLQPATLYINRTLDDSIGDPETEQSKETSSLSEATTAAVNQALSDLPAAIVWVDSFADVPLTEEGSQVQNDGAIITLGTIQPQAEGSLHVPASIYIANLAAGGQTYVLEQVDGSWVITGTTGAQWIS